MNSYAPLEVLNKGLLYGMGDAFQCVGRASMGRERNPKEILYVCVTIYIYMCMYVDVCVYNTIESLVL